MKNSGLSDLPALSVKRPLLAGVLNLLIIIAGLAALFGIEVRELPDVDRPIVTVRANFPGAAPETMDAEVTSVLEGAVARVSGVRDISSSSEENSSRLRVEFNPGVNLDVAASDVREAVSQVVRQLPDRVEGLTVVKADDDAQAVMQLAALSTTLDQETLSERIERDIVPELLSIEGVANVQVYGARERQLRVVVDPLRLSRFALTVGDVAGALRQAPFDVPVGSFTSRDQELIVRAEATAATPERIKEVVISGDTRIGDVAEVFFAPSDAQNLVRLDGEPIIGMGVIRQAQSNTIRISDQVAAKVDQLNDRFDELEIRVTSDDAEFIRGSVHEVELALFFTVVIVIGSIWLFFGSARATLIPSTAIPAALIGALAGIWIFGFSINLLTLLALVLATGLIVDDAIVVLENIQRQQSLGLGRKAAAVVGARQVFFAVVATTAVLISVFIPISFLPSTTGRLFREFGFVLALAVAISGFVALSIVPALAARLTMAHAGKDNALTKGGRKINGLYAWALRHTLDHPRIALAVAVLLASGAAFVFPSIEREVTPPEDRGVFVAAAWGPDGVGIDYMERQADQVEAVLRPYRESGEVVSLMTEIGSRDANRVFVTATLAPWTERERTPQDIIAELEAPLEAIPGVEAGAFSQGSFGWGGGNRGGLEVALTGAEYEGIYQAALLLSEAIDTRSEILENPDISYQPTQPQLSIRIDRQRASDLGVPLEELSATLRTMVDGDEVVDLNVGDRAIPILLESATDAIRNPSDLRNLSVRSQTGQLIPLSVLATIVEEGVSAELERVEQRRAIEMEAEIAPGVALSDAIAEMRRLADETLPDDVDLLFLGDAETLGEASREILITYLFAVVIVFLVLVAQFESLTSPVVVILTAPFGLAAAIYALAMTGVSLNIYSQIGLVMLIGLMAKNGILVVEFADQLRSEGRSVREAIEEAAAIRLRPIAMTSIATVLGAVPLILSTGAGAEGRWAIGWTVFAGFGMASVFTLFLAPVLYLAVARFGAPRSVGEQALERELAAAEGQGAGGPAE